MKKREPIVTTFDKCPNCGSKRRLCEQLARGEKEKGRIRPGAIDCVRMETAVIKDDAMVSKIPVGATVPAFTAYMDICTDCGTYYAKRIVVGTAVYGGYRPLPQSSPPFSRQ